MRKKLSITAAILVVLLVVGLAAFWPKDEGPLYDGKTVAWWMAHPKTNEMLSEHMGQLMFDFPEFDSNAVPYILKAVEAKDGKIKAAYIGLRAKSPPWIRRVMPELFPARNIRRHAVSALVNMGPMAKPALPMLARVASDDDTFCSTIALFCFASIGTEDADVRAVLTELAASTNSSVALYARELLRQDHIKMEGIRVAIPIKDDSP